MAVGTPTWLQHTCLITGSSSFSGQRKVLDIVPVRCLGKDRCRALRGELQLPKGHGRSDRILNYEYWDARTLRDILLDVRTSPQSADGGAGFLTAAKDAIHAAVQVSQGEVARLRRIPQNLPDGTHNPAWLAARRWRLTSSKFASVRRVGRLKQLAELLVHRKGWWYRGQERRPKVKAGHEYELKALPQYQQRMHAPLPPPEKRLRGAAKRRHMQAVMKKNIEQNLRVETIGVLVSPDSPWLAASPDGIVFDPSGKPVRLLEIKSFHFEIHARAPVWAQVQGSMAIASSCFGTPIHRCSIITPTEKHSISFDADWWNRYLLRLQSFYFNELLSAAATHVVNRLKDTEDLESLCDAKVDEMPESCLRRC